MTALELIADNLKGKAYKVLANNGETYFVTVGPVNMYFIIRNEKIIDIQID